MPKIHCSDSEAELASVGDLAKWKVLENYWLEKNEFLWTFEDKNAMSDLFNLETEEFEKIFKIRWVIYYGYIRIQQDL